MTLKSKILLYFIILLFSSCSILEKTEFQKRRYRPGYNISFASGNNVHKLIPKSKPGEDKEETAQASDTVARFTNTHDTVAVRPHEEATFIGTIRSKAPVVSKVKTIADGINKALPTPAIFKAKSSVCSAQKTSGSKYYGNGCGNILVDIAVFIVALLIILIFPGIDPQVAELIAIAVLIVAGIVVLIILGHR